MKNQKILTSFPTSIFATAKRKLQAQIRVVREQTIRRSLTGYTSLFDSVLPSDFMEGIDPTQRQRVYGFIPVFWAWLGQIIEGNDSCTKSVGLIQSWYRAQGLATPKKDTSAYCKARKRMNPLTLQRIDAKVKSHLAQRVEKKDLWRGHELLSIDGTSVSLMDTEENQKVYPQPSGQKKDCGFPIMGLVVVVNHSHGGIEDVIKCGYQKHDAKVAPELLHTIKEGDIMMGDRAFCTYEFIARVTKKRKGHVVMRLHQARARKLDWRKGKKLSSYERLVDWERPRTKSPGSNLSKQEWDALPEKLTLRYIKLGYENRAGNKEMLVVVTDLLDPDAYPAEEVADLYAERWKIEVKFRDFKTTMKMEHFAVKSPEMAHLTLQMMVITYNLIRCIMQRAALEEGKPVHEMSFQGIRYTISTSHESFRAVSKKPVLKNKLYEKLIETCAQHVLHIRPYRKEPRARKRRPKNYQLLTSSRKTFKEIPHRSKYRKAA